MQKALPPALFAGLLLLAAYLRVTGLAWGLTSGYGHFRNFHPDEFISLRGVLQIDLLRGQLKAPGAYFEGTFNYYLWAVPEAALKLFSKKESPSAVSTAAQDHADLLYICRWMTVVFDLGAVIIVFLAIRGATENFYASIFGALLYAVLPMEVIYAHYMRPHVLSNLLCSLVLWLSVRLRKSRKWWLFLIVGVISGLGAATRFPVGIIVAIPCLFIIFAPCENSTFGLRQLWLSLRYLLSGPIWLIALGFACGLFVGYPMLFLDTSSVIATVSSYTVKWMPKEEFALTRLFDLSTLWKYLSNLIPYGMYPLLWMMCYCALIYLVFRRGFYSITFAILAFSLLYLYPMAKGYVGPYWARAAMPLFPGFCILASVALNDLWVLLKKHRAGVFFLITIPLILAFPSMVFDAAYVRAMRQRDSRSTLRQDLQKLIGTNSVTIGIFSGLGSYFYTAMPAAEPLKSEKVIVQLQDSGQQADFLLIGFGRPIDPGLLNLTIKNVEAPGRFRYEKSYSVRPKIFGKELSLTRFPADMTYPFPTILLFRAGTATE
jgi:dolichyl-phosphate-mannose-protein mannosyltransferase